MSDVSPSQLAEEAGEWLDDQWDDQLTVGEWWARLADKKYSHPMLPVEGGGLGWGRAQTNAVRQVMAERGVMGPPTGLGMMLAAPTIAAHGSPEQIERWVPPILKGEHAWCQLFSEPNAGSDLAGLQCKADKDGDEWTINGQKVWTSGGQIADMGMLIARTDPDAPKHRGITWFSFEMDQPGVDVRPLREMTGRALFNEVFIDNGKVAHDAIVGGEGEGWRVANTTLLVERQSLGSSMVPLSSARPGGVRGQLDETCAAVLGQKERKGEDGVPSVGPSLIERYRKLAIEQGRWDDPLVRDALMHFHTLIQVNRMLALRARSGAVPAFGSLAKLGSSELYRLAGSVGNMIIGADGMLLGDDTASDGVVQELTQFAPGPAIYGGTDQVQRNILGERFLGLPKEPGPSKDTPFSQLEKN